VAKQVHSASWSCLNSEYLTHRNRSSPPEYRKHTHTQC
jgi:hypothetical protein